MFERCLRSIKDCQDSFDLIVISLNGSEIAEDCAALESSNIEKSRIRVLKTETLLSPARHQAWASRAMKSFLRKTDHVLILAHDDELDSPGLDHWMRTRPSGWHLRAWIGDYRFIDDRDPEIPPFQVRAIPDAKLVPLGLCDWLAVNEADPRKFVDTNMSGISVPYSTLLRTSRFITATRMTQGARFEYILVSSRSNLAIDRRSPPVGIIHLHPDQAGRSVPPAKQQMDEARYCLWLVLNAKTFDELRSILASSWGLRRLARSFRRALSESVRLRIRRIATDASAKLGGDDFARSTPVS